MVEFNAIKRPRKAFRLLPTAKSTRSMILRTGSGMTGVMTFILVGLVVTTGRVSMCGNGFSTCGARIPYSNIVRCWRGRFIG